MLNKLLVFNVIPVTILINLGSANSYDENRAVQPQIECTYGARYGKTFSLKAKYITASKEHTTELQLIFKKRQLTNKDWCDVMPDPGYLNKQPPTQNSWIALIRIPSDVNRTCSCSQRLSTAKDKNASAVILLFPEDQEHSDCNGKEDLIVVSPLDPSKLYHAIDSRNTNNNIKCTIKEHEHARDKAFRVSKTSVLFVLVSFILLMCISLAWLVFYYVQRFRHIYRNDRKEKQLLSAAKKAISKLKTIPFNSATLDGEDDSCAVCLENYKDGENIRILPCKHLFHKSCIDPWLLNHRTCPMCKSNILKSLGVEIPDNIDLSQYDMESRRISREHERENQVVHSSPSASSPPHDEREGLDHDHDEDEDDVVGAGVDVHNSMNMDNLPSTSVFTPGTSSSQAWSEEPNGVTASICSSTSSMLSDTDSERSTVALVSVVQKV